VSATPISDPLSGERVVALVPENAAEAANAWRRRPNLFPGRALTAAALSQQQQWQAGRLAKRGQHWSAGIVAGLELEASLAPAEAGLAAVRIDIGKGRGIAVSGEDVVLNSPLHCRLADVPVVAPDTFFADGSGTGPRTPKDLENELRHRSVGVSLGELAPAALANLPRVGVLLLQPAQVEASTVDASDPCDRCAWPGDPTATAVQEQVLYEDKRVADAVRLLWYVWPEEWSPIGAMPAATLRNGVAWTIFGAEAGLPAGGSLPWEAWGVPIALVALNAQGQPAWIDRASVVRQGGKARQAGLCLAGNGMAANSRLPGLWQAQVEQFAEQTAAAITPDGLPYAESFCRFLPSVGLLPRSAYDPKNALNHFFPGDCAIDAVPVPVDQIDVAMRQAAALAPFDVGGGEAVRVLVPVPASSWDPRLLAIDTIDPLFLETISRFQQERSQALLARQGLRNEHALLARAITGQPQAVPPYDDDAEGPETLTTADYPPPGGGHRSSLREGFHAMRFEGATPGFVVTKLHSLYAWVYLDANNPPTSLALSWHAKDASGWSTAYWGEAVGELPGQRRGDLPAPGRWHRLSIPVGANNYGVEFQFPADAQFVALDGMSFAVVGGRAAFGPTGKTSFGESGETEEAWFSNVLPAGAQVAAQAETDDPWEPLSENDLWAPFDPAGGVVPGLPDSVPGDGGHFEASAKGKHQHYFTNATAMVMGASDSWIYAWVYVDADDPPAELMLQWYLGGNWEQRAFWGRDLIALGTPDTSSRRRLGAMPIPGRWTQLKVKPEAVGIAGKSLAGMAFTLYNGCAAFGEVGRIDANGGEHPWFSSSPPGTPTLKGEWQPLSKAELHAPTPSARIGRVEAMQALMEAPALSAALSDEERAQLPLRGLAPFAEYLRGRLDRADDLIDYGFLKIQTDIYRLRHVMLGSEANRLVVSPALASIAQAETAVATQAQLADYVAKIKTEVANGN
jgi:hypothetical protein